MATTTCSTAPRSGSCNGALAGLILLFARAEGGHHRLPGGAETPGLKVGYREKTLGLRGVSCNTLYLDDARVPAANRLGEEGQGLKIALQALDLSRLGMGALALGGAERALEEAVQFSHGAHPVRRAHRPEADHPELYRRRQGPDRGAALPGGPRRLAGRHGPGLSASRHPSSSSLAPASAYEVTNKMLQVHGGYGYMKEYAIERYYRDCRALEIIEGTSQIQQFLIARDVYKAEGLEIALGTCRKLARDSEDGTMDFTFPKEYQLFRRMVREFCRERGQAPGQGHRPRAPRAPRDHRKRRQSWA